MTSSKELREMFSPYSLMSQANGNEKMLKIMTEILDRLEAVERKLNGKEARDSVPNEGRQSPENPSEYI